MLAVLNVSSFFLSLAPESTGLLYQPPFILPPLPPEASESPQVLSVGNLTRQLLGQSCRRWPPPPLPGLPRPARPEMFYLEDAGPPWDLILTELANSC